MSSISDADVAEIRRISDKKSIRKIATAVRQDLDRETLARMIAAYLVLKADGHTDNEFVKYLTTKETRRTLKLGFGAAKVVLPSLLTDAEFRSLVINTRKQMKKQKKTKEAKQKQPQREVVRSPGDETKVSPVMRKVEAPIPESSSSSRSSKAPLNQKNHSRIR